VIFKSQTLPVYDLWINIIKDQCAEPGGLLDPALEALWSASQPKKKERKPVWLLRTSALPGSPKKGPQSFLSWEEGKWSPRR
jgi:hypothetical protein